jgi:TIGR03009 family protein
MRIFTYAALVLVLTPLWASAQETVDTVLRGWEKAMVELQSFACEVQRKTTDSVFGSDEYKGYAMFMKPQVKGDGSRARLQMSNVKNQEQFEKFIVTGPFLYQYAPGTKTIYIHDMPQGKDAAANQESFLSFLFGMGAEQAKARYDMKLVYPSPGKPDPNYHYLEVTPKSDKDKSDFAQARLSLLRSNHLPAQIWYLQANKKVIEWNFSKLQLNVNIPADKYFVFEDIKGWRSERAPQGPQAGPVIKKK